MMAVATAEVRDAMRRVRGALADKTVVEYQTFYLLQEGRIHAQNGRMWASTPCPIDGEFLVSGAEFERAIDKIPAEKLAFEQSPDGDMLRVKGGRFRTDIQTLDPALFNRRELDDPQPVAVDGDKLRYALRQLRPFVSDNATKPFALCYWLGHGRALATNNVTLVECSDSGLAPDVNLLLPQWVADYILSVDSALVFMETDGRRIATEWEDGTHLWATLGNQPWPEQALGLLDAVGATLTDAHLVDEEWRKNILRLRDMGENQIEITATEMRTGKGRSSTRLEIASATPVESDSSVWSFDFIAPALEKATHIDITQWPKPMAFAWDRIRGLAAARNK